MAKAALYLVNKLFCKLDITQHTKLKGSKKLNYFFTQTLLKNVGKYLDLKIDTECDKDHCKFLSSQPVSPTINAICAFSYLVSINHFQQNLLFVTIIFFVDIFQNFLYNSLKGLWWWSCIVEGLLTTEQPHLVTILIILKILFLFIFSFFCQ